MKFHPEDLSELDELTEEHLGFSALSDGLGFTRAGRKNPPAPEKDAGPDILKAQKAFSGIGAVAAGPAMPAFAGPSLKPAAPSAAAMVLSSPAAPRGLRVAAFFLDFLVIFLPFAGAWRFSFGSGWRALLSAEPRPALWLFFSVFFAYFLLSESFGGQSIGKMLLGLRVVEDDKYQKPASLGRTTARLLLLLVGTALLGIGQLASFRDPKRRPWHDRLSGTIVRQV